MKAICWEAPTKVKVETVPDPTILNPRDAIVKVTSAALCGSDLHLYDGYVPTMMPGDIIGHEFMGEVVEVGREITNLKVGDKVVVPFTISCGKCYYCQTEQWSLCDNSNPHAAMMETMYGYAGAGIYGYSHLLGGYAGSQAQFTRVPFADVGPIKVPEEIPDDKLLFLSDSLCTGWHAALNCNIKPGDTVAVWGAGGIGLFCALSAYLQGAEQVIVIDRYPERLEMAAKHTNAKTLNYSEVNVTEALKELTGGRGPDACIDAVGMEAHGFGLPGVYDKVKQTLRLETDRIHAVREAIQACRKGGTVSIPGVYAGFADKFPIGALFGKGLTIKTGQTHVQRYLKPLLAMIVEGKLDPSFPITHHMKLDQAEEAYEMFKHKHDNCVRAVFNPNS